MAADRHSSGIDDLAQQIPAQVPSSQSLKTLVTPVKAASMLIRLSRQLQIFGNNLLE